MSKQPGNTEANPQGKGLVPVLDWLHQQDPARPRTTGGEEGSQALAVPTGQALLEYLVSRWILCAEFNFRVVPETDYYLYLNQGRLGLSLIAPSQWHQKSYGIYLGQCRLTPERTWSLAMAPEAREFCVASLSSLRNTLLSDLASDAPLTDTLPHFDDRLPFHRRVLANALARTTRARLGDKIHQTLPSLLVQHAPEAARLEWFECFRATRRRAPRRVTR